MRITRNARVIRNDPIDDARPFDVAPALGARRRRAAAVPEREVYEVAVPIVECPKDENILFDLLSRTPREPRHRRPGDYAHVSDLLTKCVRKIALCDRYGTPVRPQRLSAADIICFAQGDAIHDSVKALVSKASPANVWGKWSCKCGYLHHTEPCTLAELDMDEICPQCDTPTDTYHEVAMHNEEYKVVGNPDLILYFGEVDAYHITELKSIAHDAWEELVRPKPDHVLQVLFYWFLMRSLGYRVTDRVSILYVTKGYIFKGKPYKEFMLDPAKELHRLDPYLDEARLLKLSRTDVTATPARTHCTNDLAPKARQCEVCQQCFAID